MSRYVSCPIIHGLQNLLSYKISLKLFLLFGNKGSVAHRLTGKKYDTATHRWTVYIRGQGLYDDLSSIVSKVVFSLHPSFDEPLRG